MPTLSQLEYLIAVLRTGHFGRAAEECHIAQPTLSTQVQKAEQELGVTLFDRSQNPIRATPQGKRLLEHAQEVLAAHERLLWAAEEHAGRLSGTLSLGVIPTLAPYVIPWFLRSFAEAHPQVQLSIHERPTDTLVDEMHRQRLDAAVLATPLHEKPIVEHRLFFDPFYLYAHKSDPLLKHDELDPSALDSAKLWLLEDGHCVRHQVVSYCRIKSTGEHFGNVSFAAGGFETLRNLIDATGGYSLFPETYVRTLPRTVQLAQVRPFAPTSPVREVSLCYLRSAWKTRVFDALANAIKDALPRSLRHVLPDSDVLPVR